MAVLSWLLIPLAATLVAMLLVTWLSRPRRSVEKYDQVEQFHRFCEAMENGSTKRRRSGGKKPITRMLE